MPRNLEKMPADRENEKEMTIKKQKMPRNQKKMSVKREKVREMTIKKQKMMRNQKKNTDSERIPLD